MKSQLENDRVLNACFISSLVGYFAKRTSCSIDFFKSLSSLRIFCERMQFRIGEISPLETDGIIPTRRDEI
jgi:hypothetical protein